MQNVLALFGLVLIALSGFSQSSTIPSDTTITAFTNGSWFDRHSFKKKTAYLNEPGCPGAIRRRARCDHMRSMALCHFATASCRCCR